MHIGGNKGQRVLLEGAVPGGHKARRGLRVPAGGLVRLVLEVEVSPKEGVFNWVKGLDAANLGEPAIKCLLPVEIDNSIWWVVRVLWGDFKHVEVAWDHDGVLDEGCTSNAVFNHDDGARAESLVWVGEVVAIDHPAQKGGVGLVGGAEFGLLDQTEVGGCDVMGKLLSNLSLPLSSRRARERVGGQTVGVGRDDAGVWDPRGGVRGRCDIGWDRDGSWGRPRKNVRGGHGGKISGTVSLWNNPQTRKTFQ